MLISFKKNLRAASSRSRRTDAPCLSRNTEQFFRTANSLVALAALSRYMSYLEGH